MVNSEDKLDQHQNWGQNSEPAYSYSKHVAKAAGDVIKASTDVIKASSDVIKVNDVNTIKSTKIAEVVVTPQDKGGGGAAPENQGQNNDLDVSYLDNGTSYYYYYYPPEEQFGYSEEAPVVVEESGYCEMVAYPYSYEAGACQGEEGTGDEEQLPSEDLQEVEPAAGALLLPHNDLFINPAFSYLQFLSDGSVVGPMGEIYSPANYFPAHAAATGPVVDVCPPQTAGEFAPPDLLMQTDYGGKTHTNYF